MRKFDTSGIKVKIFNFLNLRTFRLNPHCMCLKFKEYLQKSMIRLRLINWVIYTLILYVFACNSRQDKLMVIYSKNCRILEGHTHVIFSTKNTVLRNTPLTQQLQSHSKRSKWGCRLHNVWRWWWWPDSGDTASGPRTPGTSCGWRSPAGWPQPSYSQL